jgi:hybrid cluster-associated redox disulfide protein
MSRITRDSFIMDVLMMDRGAAEIFMRHGMHCLGCPSSSGESIGDACAVHGIDADKLVDDLNEYFNSKQIETR